MQGIVPVKINDIVRNRLKIRAKPGDTNAKLSIIPDHMN